MTLFIISIMVCLSIRNSSLNNLKLEIILDLGLIVICWVLLNIDSWIRGAA